MKISVSWLNEFVDIQDSPRELKSVLTMLGLNTEAVIPADDDWVLDIEVTTNRPDCLSHYGVARELAAHYGQPLKRIVVSLNESGGPTHEAVSIAISDPDLCARYCGRVVRNVKVKPSPDWLVKRLEAVGQRSINNVADVTNYVLMELGHPLHAFDLGRLNERKIIVRRARPGEHLRTLDGVDRTLTRDNLVIADVADAVALAGVMGGHDSGISPGTETVLLESAWFEPLSIRRTSKSQGLHTEASHRFERGADIMIAPLALDRAAALIQEVAGGVILEGIIDVFPRPKPRLVLDFSPSEIERILGAEIPHAEAVRILRALGFHLEPASGERWRVGVPLFRVDVSRGVDLVEEVARHAGYDRLPARARPAPPSVERDVNREKEITASSLLVNLGFHEIITSSMVDPQESANFSDAQPVVLANPLSQDASAMRTSAVPSMVRAILWNLDRGVNNVQLFEMGKTYSMTADEAPEEHRVLCLGATGHRRPASVYDTQATLNFFDLKGDLEAIFQLFDLSSLDFEISERPYLQKCLAGSFRSSGAELAIFGKIAETVAHDYKLRQDVWLAEIDFERLLGFPLRARKFSPVSKFPAVERDFSLVVPDGVTYSRLAAAVASVGLEEIRGFRPIDRADRRKAPSLPPGHYALLLRVEFQSLTHTLTSEEVNRFSERVLSALKPLEVSLRS